MTTGIVLTENRHAGGFMVSEAPGRYSRDAILIGASQAIIAGQILGEITAGDGGFAAAAAVAAAGNTGTGTVSAPTVGAGVLAGTYRMVAIAPLVWEVFDPNGNMIGEARDSVAFAGEIGFTVTHSATAFVAGDAFTVLVTETDPAASGEYVALSLTATDGSENAAAISWANVTTAAGQTTAATVIRREAEVRGVDLTYPTGATTNQIAAINAQLAAIGIIVR